MASAGWFSRASKWSITSGLYCTWNAFRQQDVYVEVRIPGGITAFMSNKGQRCTRQTVFQSVFESLNGCEAGVQCHSMPGPKSMCVLLCARFIRSAKAFLACGTATSLVVITLDVFFCPFITICFMLVAIVDARIYFSRQSTKPNFSPLSRRCT